MDEYFLTRQLAARLRRRQHRARHLRQAIGWRSGLLAAIAVLLIGCGLGLEASRQDLASSGQLRNASSEVKTSPEIWGQTPPASFSDAAETVISPTTDAAIPMLAASATALPLTVPSIVPSQPSVTPRQAVSLPNSLSTSVPISATSAARPSVPVSAEEVVRGDPARPWLSLVFNVGAGFKPATAILDVLKDKNVRTTFFVMGWWAAKQPELVQRFAAGGHEIASHGYEVFDLTQVSDAEVRADLEKADDVIKGITGRSTRPLWSASASYRDDRTNGLASSLGYRPIFWTLDSGDWREDASAAGVRQRVIDGAINGAIIVMHFDSPRSADAIAPVLPSIIDSLRSQGFRLVTISELITGQLIAQR